MFPKLGGEIKPHMYFKGKKVLTWSLNNYLGLANHPEVRKVDAEAAAKWGLGYPMGARMMSGNSDLHEEFETQLGDFVKKEAVMLLNYGYQGIFSIIDAITSRRDVIIYDSEAHACIVDGVRLHLGKRFVFSHNDIGNLREQLVRATKIANERGGGILIVTEGVFGMSGDVGKLKEIVALKKEFQFRLLVDDAHGFGTIGKTGAGAVEEQNVQEETDLYFSTFAKSMASIGAFVAGDKDVIEYLRYNTRSQIFAKSLPMPFVVGNMKRLELLRTTPELKDKLWIIVNSLQSGLKEEGFNIGNTKSPVTPVFLKGDDGVEEVVALVADLRENFNIFCSAVIYPVVPKDVILLRLIPTAVHTKKDVKETISAFKAIKDKLLTGQYKKMTPEQIH
ncbi:MAG: pyridoxal phosphate-dependent aminotransferase family protein [Cytophagales bacterium]|nr:pyridoxal phosphate-dependent aminotransferase family protein [Cytophagales bacterium]